MIHVYLKAVGTGPKVTAIQAVRKTCQMLGNTTGAMIPEAKRIYEHVQKHGVEILLGNANDIEEATEAVRLLTEAGCDGEAREGITEDGGGRPITDSVPEPSPGSYALVVENSENGESDFPPYDAAQVAAIMLVVTNGSPSRTLQALNTLDEVLPENIFADARRFLLDTFKPMDQQMILPRPLQEMLQNRDESEDT